MAKNLILHYGVALGVLEGELEGELGGKPTGEMVGNAEGVDTGGAVKGGAGKGVKVVFPVGRADGSVGAGATKFA